MSDMTMPYLSTDLIRRLKGIFKPVYITPETSLEKIMYNAGEQRVINYLIQIEKSMKDSDDTDNEIDEIVTLHV